MARRPQYRRNPQPRNSHRRPQGTGANDDPSQIQATRRYLTDARRCSSSDQRQEFYDEMLALHPDRLNPGALWGAAITLFPSS